MVVGRHGGEGSGQQGRLVRLWGLALVGLALDPQRGDFRGWQASQFECPIFKRQVRLNGRQSDVKRVVQRGVSGF